MPYRGTNVIIAYHLVWVGNQLCEVGRVAGKFLWTVGSRGTTKALSSGDLSCVSSGQEGGCSCSRIEGQAVGRLWQWERTEEDEASHLGGGHQNETEATLSGGFLGVAQAGLGWEKRQNCVKRRGSGHRSSILPTHQGVGPGKVRKAGRLEGCEKGTNTSLSKQEHKE